MSEGNFAGTRDGAAADQAGIGNGVVRRAERAHADEPGAGIEHAGNTVNLGGLQRLFKGKGRQDRRHALGEHGLAGTGRADHQDVVAAGAGDFQSALGGLLSTNVFEVDGVSAATSLSKASLSACSGRMPLPVFTK